MAVSSADYEEVMKEIWTQDTLEQQFHDGDGVLDQVEKTNKYNIGKQASVPTHMERSGGYTIVPPGGSSSLNGSDKQKVDKAVYNYARHWFEIQLDTAAIERSEGPLAVAGALDTEVSGGIADMRHNIAAQIYGDGTGNIAKCGSTTAASAVVLDSAWAIERGFLYPGLKVDIGTAGSESSIAADKEITAVDPVAKTITIGSTTVTTTGSHFVSIANSRSGTTFYGSNGLGNIVSASSTLGGLATSTYWRWASAVDTTSADISLAKLLALRTKITQARGKPDWNVMSPVQENNFYQLLQSQVRFSSDSVEAGSEKVKWSGMQIDGQVDCPDPVWYMLTKKNIFAVRIDKPYWVSQKHGGNILLYKTGTTYVSGAAEYMLNLATNNRAAHGKMTALNTTLSP